LNPAGLRKSAAQAGLSPIGSNDELLIALVDHLAKNTKAPMSSSSSSAASSATGTESNSKADPIRLAARVLELADDSLSDPVIILKLADPTVIIDITMAGRARPHDDE
jgi:hypothetical protein